MSNLVCDFYDDDGALDGPWHWSTVLCRGCFESHMDWRVRVSPTSESWESVSAAGIRHARALIVPWMLMTMSCPLQQNQKSQKNCFHRPNPSLS